MMRSRFGVWLLVALAIPAQAMAAYSLQLPCADDSGATVQVVEMDCHSAAAQAGAGEQGCCSNSCPDMMACAAAHAAVPAAIAAVLLVAGDEPADRCTVPSLTPPLALPFRPPALSNA